MDNMPKKRSKLAEDVDSLEEPQETKVELKKKVSELEDSLKIAKRKADDYKFQLKGSHQKHREPQETIVELKEKVSELEEKVSELEENVSEMEENVSELKYSHRIAKRKADDYKFQLKVSHRKHQEAADDLEAVENAFVEGLETLQEDLRGGIVDSKQMGIFGREVDLGSAEFYNRLEGKDPSFKCKSDFMEFWEARVREPDFHASALEDDGNGNMKYTIDEHHEELNQVREIYGDKAYEAVCNAHLEVMEWGTGFVMWHYNEKRKATMSEVLQHCDLEILPKGRPI